MALRDLGTVPPSVDAAHGTAGRATGRGTRHRFGRPPIACENPAPLPGSQSRMQTLDVLVPPSPLDTWEAEIQVLVDAGRAKGHLTYQELNTALPEKAPSPEMMDRILQVIDFAGIEVIDGEVKRAREERESRAAKEAAGE